MGETRNKDLEHNLDIHGLRGIAALMVFAFHIFDLRLVGAGQRFLSLPDITDGNLPLPAAIAIGSLSAGVEIFYMISGYLITASLLHHKQVKLFLWHRVIRIYPAFLVIFVPTFFFTEALGIRWMDGLSVIPLSRQIEAFLTNVFLLPGILEAPLIMLNAWSLSYEMTFYLIAACLYALWRRNAFSFSELLPLLLFISLPLYPLATYLAVGAGIYWLTQHPPRFLAMVKPWWGAVALSVMLIGYGAVQIVDRNDLGPLLRPQWQHLNLLLAPIGGIFFFCLVQQQLFSSWLRWRWVQFMGTISYSFYLIHLNVITWMIQQRILSVTGWPAWTEAAAFTFFAFGLSLLLAWPCYELIEKRLGAALRAKLR
jgi:peptidoglycan/LPS O-acetylase OafA/YrhL